jgi:hypothetical protein
MTCGGVKYMKVQPALLVTFALAVLTIPAPAQTTSPSAVPEKPGLTLRTGVQFVEVSIVATGAKGAPVEDLSARDFRVGQRDGADYRQLREAQFGHPAGYRASGRHLLESGRQCRAN